MKFKFLVTLLYFPLLLFAQQEVNRDVHIQLAENIEYYGFVPQKISSKNLLGYSFKSYELIWQAKQTDDSYFVKPSNNGGTYYFKHEFSIANNKNVVIQIAFNNLDLKDKNGYRIEPSKKVNPTVSDLFKDILPEMIDFSTEEESSIYLSILSKSDLQTLNLYNENFMTSYFIYLVWNNANGKKLPKEYKGGTHILLYGENRPIHYQEKVPIEIAENNTSKSASQNVVQENSEKPQIAQNNIEDSSTNPSSEEVKPERKPEVSTVEINNEKALNFFQNNLGEIKGFNNWKATNSGKIAFFDCSVALPNDQMLIDQQNLNFDLFVEAKNHLPAFEKLSDDNLLKRELPVLNNLEEKHANDKYITQKLKNLFTAHLGLKKPEMQVSVSNDEKTITINNLSGHLNGMNCMLSPIEVPLKYVDHFVLAQFDSTVIFDNISVDISDVLNEVSFHTNSGKELQINKSSKSIAFSPLLYGHRDGIEIRDNNDSNDLYTTGYSVKNNYLTIYYSVDQHFTVMVIYPHFFQNKRTLTQVIDEKMKKMKEQNGKYLIYLASEFNSKVFKTEDDRKIVLETLGQMYGNLIPSFTSDYQQLLTVKENYLNKLNNSKYLVSAEYSFFIPSQFWPEFKEKFLGDIDVNNQGNMIIPKKFIENILPQTSINLYFPEGSTHVQPGKINNYKCNVFEI